jgi:16S rRNA (guanine966-N2)-methyltransferase
MSRIVGGAAGGRRLRMRAGHSTRPTPERAREGLFSSLGGDLTGRSFLDLYAGSGAVGLEAVSRGASPVVLVERDPGALKVLRDNVAALGLPGARVVPLPVQRYLSHGASAEEHQLFDVVFVDPPYADAVEGVLVSLLHDWLTPDAVVVVERATRDQFKWPAGLVTERSRRYGDSTLWYGRRP